MTHLCQLNQTAAFTNSRQSAQPQPSLQLQRGASLLEGIAYLGIAAVVVLGAVSLLGNAFSSAKSNQAIEEIVSIRTAVRKLYMGQAYPKTGSEMTAALIAANAIPSTLTRSSDGKSLTHTWGGGVKIEGVGDGYTITYSALPKEICMSMVSGANGWVNVSKEKGAPIITFPVSAEDAIGVCTESTGNTVSFKGGV
ncbi:type 4 pilus major pilin [Massilia sp. YIM B04103]|uniref:type 4 pilus major pilin n=1 Tax=Massilia sp. YIM B04103 TaxID=2963106 RepID=UPI002109F340|nr:type 4 pilus major pilin [Massilia sp. YIM B04103]